MESCQPIKILKNKKKTLQDVVWTVGGRLYTPVCRWSVTELDAKICFHLLHILICNIRELASLGSRMAGRQNERNHQSQVIHTCSKNVSASVANYSMLRVKQKHTRNVWWEVDSFCVSWFLQYFSSFTKRIWLRILNYVYVVCLLERNCRTSKIVW